LVSHLWQVNSGTFLIFQKNIREQSGSALLVGGGPHLTLYPQDILATNLDAVCVGEGELPLKLLLQGKDIKDIQGWVYRDADGGLVYNKPFDFIDLANLPIANHLDWNEYETQKGYFARRILFQEDVRIFAHTAV